MIKAFLDYASQRYYAGNPTISDAEFDNLADAYNYERVGAAVRDGIPHAFSMYSLQKCYTDEPRIDLDGDVVETAKLDGAAISLLYIRGKLSLALTRGDGKRGHDITDKIRHLVPSTIGEVAVTQVTGEIVAPKSIPNSRNYASGALNLKDPEEVRTRDLRFIAYGLQDEIETQGTFHEDMGQLREWGFSTVTDSEWEEYPHDGRVFRLDDNSQFKAAGYTAKHPKGAYALKERQGGVVTTLLGVDWQLGRTGVVSPVALLEPVKVGDATVSRATLHNIKYIEELNLEIGCKVELVRAGEIIPRVVRRVK